MEKLVKSRELSAGALSAVIAALIAGITAFALLWIGVQDNNQGEFYDPLSGQIDWRYCVLVYAANFVAVFLVSWGAAAAVILLVRGIR